MPESDDIALLKEYAASGSETAFAALVGRHVNLVYSAALRSAGDPHAAQEIAQAVFIILARKAGSLADGWQRRLVAAVRLSGDGGVAAASLSGWLYQTTRLTAANYLRGEIRRQKREQEACMESTLNEPALEAWPQIAPLLDDAMGRLGGKDRDAIVLRFFENKNLAEVGAALGASEDAAKMRVNRALDKLRKFFSQRGVDSTTAAIAENISAHSVQVAPAALAKTISAVALAKGAAGSTSTLTLVKGALKIMAWTKAKTAIVAGASILTVALTATVSVKEYRLHRTYSWQVPRADFNVFYRSPAGIKIVPTKFAKDGGWCADSGRGAMGIAQQLKDIIQAAYQQDSLHVLITVDLPTNRYDFIAKLVGPQQPHKNLPNDPNWAVELQKQIARQFGFTGSLELRATPVLVLQPGNMGVRGFQVSHSMPKGQAIATGRSGGSSFYEQPISSLTSLLRQRFQMPIVDQTGLRERYDFSLSWDEPDGKHPNLDGLKQALREQLGLELVPTNMPIEMLVVEKAK